MLPIQMPHPGKTDGAERPAPRRPLPRPPSLRIVLVHAFLIGMELVVFAIQFMRMEVFAFDVIPEIADLELFGIFGSQIVAGAWVMVMIFVSYGTWEVTVLFAALEREATMRERATLGLFWLANVAAMGVELFLFHEAVDDRVGTGIFGVAEIFAALLVFVHQVASWWVVTNILPHFLFARRETVPARDETAPHDRRNPEA